jgi:opacity protein-like surface antigen
MTQTLRSRALAAATALGGALALSAAASAQTYVSGSAGFNFQRDSANSGEFTSNFTTGDGVAVPPGTVLPAGTELGWNTEFETGYFVSGAFGWRMDNGLRFEGELSYLAADVDTHTDVQAGGAALGGADAAVLITGADPLGVTVADLVADGRGDISSFGVMANAYYDFIVPDSALSLYVGGGLGFANVDVTYRPSDVGIVSDSDTVFAWQLMGGGAYRISENVEWFAGYRYRATEDVSVNVDLVPARLDIENRSHIVETGLRFYF